MLDQLRDRIAAYLAEHRLCVVSAHGAPAAGTFAAPALYRMSGLELACTLPRWTDVLYLLEQDGHALIIVADELSEGKRWLEYHGKVVTIAPAPMDEAPGGAGARVGDGRQVTLLLAPIRIDLIDERLGWGVRETLDC